MNAKQTPLNGLKIIIPTVHEDERGFFKEVIHPQKLAKFGINHRFVQVNQSRSRAWTLRGLHFQHAPYAQAKLVRCLRGKIYDVAVDVRPNSPTFGQWYGEELTEDNHQMMYVPIGFAHGFLALTDCDIEYACSDIYAQNYEQSIRWDDPELGIDWPLNGNQPDLSIKDKTASLFSSIKDELEWPNEAYIQTGSDVK